MKEEKKNPKPYTFPFVLKLLSISQNETIGLKPTKNSDIQMQVENPRQSNTV